MEDTSDKSSVGAISSSGPRNSGFTGTNLKLRNSVVFRSLLVIPFPSPLFLLSVLPQQTTEWIHAAPKEQETHYPLLRASDELHILLVHVPLGDDGKANATVNRLWSGKAALPSRRRA